MLLLRVPLLCLLLLCGVAGMPPSLAQEPTEPVELRHFDQQALEEYRNDPAYRYDRDLQREPSAWERFKEWLRDLLQSFLGSGLGGFLGSNLMYLLMLLALVLVIWLLSKGPLRAVFHGAPRSLGEVTAVEEDIRELDLPALIAEAERMGDLRRAIRLHYLLVLRLLVDRGVLQWAPQHTDRDYLAQIEDPTLRQRFAQAARTFQWTWYGHAAVTPSRYEALRVPFLQFEKPQAA